MWVRIKHLLLAMLLVGYFMLAILCSSDLQEYQFMIMMGIPAYKTASNKDEYFVNIMCGQITNMISSWGMTDYVDLNLLGMYIVI